MPRKLSVQFVERIWGSTELEPWYRNPSAKTGEVWLETVPGIPLLIKFIFTTEALSIQVHPNDEQARAAGEERGKTEMWVVLRAGENARIGVGLREPIPQERLRSACESGEIELLLDWKAVRAGDAILVEAGTIHAIGGGIVLCEIQQESDITYRLYDYGRARMLHLDRGIKVSNPAPHPGVIPPRALAPGIMRRAACRYFVTDEIEAGSSCAVERCGAAPELLICVAGEGKFDGDDYHAGEAWLVSEVEGPLAIEPRRASRFLRTYVP